MEVEIEISNLRDEIKALKREIEILKVNNTKLIDDTTNLNYKYSDLDNERLKIVAENKKIKADMIQVTQPAEE